MSFAKGDNDVGGSLGVGECRLVEGVPSFAFVHPNHVGVSRCKGADPCSFSNMGLESTGYLASEFVLLTPHHHASGAYYHHHKSAAELKR